MACRVMIPSDQVLRPGHKIPLNQFIESDMSMFCTNSILPKFTTMNYYTYTLCCSSPTYFLQASSSSHQWSLEILQQTALQNRTRRISRFSSAASACGRQDLLWTFPGPDNSWPPRWPFHAAWWPVISAVSLILIYIYIYIYIIYIYIDICVSLYVDLLLKPRNSRVSSCVLAEKGSLPRSMKYRMTPAANTSTSGDWQSQQRSSLTGDAEGLTHIKTMTCSVCLETLWNITGAKICWPTMDWCTVLKQEGL